MPDNTTESAPDTRTQPNPPQCPNKGPGRLEGNTHPCIPALLDSWNGDGHQDETFGDTEVMGEWAAFFTIPAAFSQDPTADLEAPASDGSHQCAKCLQTMKGAYGAGLFVDSQGFLTADIFATEGEYASAVEHARRTEEADHADCSCPPIGDSSDCIIHSQEA